MNFKGHFIGSCVAGISLPLVAKALDSDGSFVDQDAVVVALSVVLGGNSPDVDTHSTPSRVYSLLSMLAMIYFGMTGQWILIAFIITPFLLAKASRHRGWTHSYVFPALLLGLAHLFPSYYHMIASFAAGLVVHYVLDSIYPWRRRSWIAA